jgi:hypothetical protein
MTENLPLADPFGIVHISNMKVLFVWVVFRTWLFRANKYSQSDICIPYPKFLDVFRTQDPESKFDCVVGSFRKEVVQVGQAQSETLPPFLGAILVQSRVVRQSHRKKCSWNFSYEQKPYTAYYITPSQSTFALVVFGMCLVCSRLAQPNGLNATFCNPSPIIGPSSPFRSASKSMHAAADLFVPRRSRPPFALCFPPSLSTFALHSMTTPQINRSPFRSLKPTDAVMLVWNYSRSLISLETLRKVSLKGICKPLWILSSRSQGYVRSAMHLPQLKLTFQPSRFSFALFLFPIVKLWAL